MRREDINMEGNTRNKLIGIIVAVILIILIFTVLVGGNPTLSEWGYG